MPEGSKIRTASAGANDSAECGAGVADGFALALGVDEIPGLRDGSSEGGCDEVRRENRDEGELHVELKGVEMCGGLNENDEVERK
jgi:hypothetical protein